MRCASPTLAGEAYEERATAFGRIVEAVDRSIRKMRRPSYGRLVVEGMTETTARILNLRV